VHAGGGGQDVAAGRGERDEDAAGVGRAAGPGQEAAAAQAGDGPAQRRLAEPDGAGEVADALAGAVAGVEAEQDLEIGDGQPAFALQGGGELRRRA
jgi:hypothetical protein